MSDTVLKPEKDFSKETDKQIPEAEKLAKVRQHALAAQCCPNDGFLLPGALLTPLLLEQNDVTTAIEKLALLEKQTRQVSRRPNHSRPLAPAC